MGFTTGFVGGLTLTYSILYLSLHIHRQNRIYQSTLINQQRSLLQQIYDPPSEITDSPAYEVRKAGLTEQLKDRWNRELSTAVRNLQEKDWEAARIKWEHRAEDVWRSVGGAERVQDVKEKMVEVGETASKKAIEVKDGIVSAGRDAKENLKGKGKEAKREIKEATGQKRLLEL